MGWSSGTYVATDLIHAINDNVKDKKIKKALYTELLESLTNHDWDCVDESLDIDPVWDAIAKKYMEDNE